MSEVTDCKQSADHVSRKRCLSPERVEDNAVPSKSSKPSNASDTREVTSKSGRDSGVENQEVGSVSKDTSAVLSGSDSIDATSSHTVTNLSVDGQGDNNSDKPQSSDAKEEPGKSNTPLDQSDSAAIAAAEALASLTGGDGEDSEEVPCSSNKSKQVKQLSKVKQRVGHQSSKSGSKTQAAAADSSTSMHSTAREDADDVPEAEEGDESMSGTSSTASSSFASENDDGECAIVSVKMAPEMRQSVALLAQVQMKLEALEKKSARLHQRLDVKINRQRRPHLDQRSSIAKTIPGFWVTALLNHPHLSAHIDETDEDALSYMTDLEIETFKNNKLGYRIRFHFRRNPYFQNNIIMKELHLGMGGSPMSFSNPVLWHRGHNLTTHSEPRKTARGVYQTFFNWFSDHSNPAQDDVAQILKDDLFRDPLRYYLTPLWEPRENGSGASGTRVADNGNGDDCVVISDSEDEPEEEASEEAREAEGDHSKEGQEDEGGEEDDEEEEAEEEEDEEQEEGTRPGADESLAEEEDEEDEGGEIVIDGSDDTDQEEA